MKKLTALFLSLLMTLAVIPAGAFSGGGYPNGDLNRDRKLNVHDATIIQMYLAGLYRFVGDDFTLADYNLDGDINVLDVTIIQKVIVGLTEEPDPSSPTVEPTTQAPATEAPSTQPPTQAPTTEPTQPATQAPTTEPTQPVTQAPTTEPTQPITTAPIPTTVPVPTVETAPNPEVKTMIDIYFTNNKNWSSVYFYLYNSADGTPEVKWPGRKITKYTSNNYGEKTYSATADVSKYDRIIFNNGASSQTVNIPLGKASSGFYISDDSNSAAMMVGTYAATGADSGKIITTKLRYPSGYDKKIWIWTPADYSASSKDKYRTIYMMDGQNLFDADHTDAYGGWEVTDAIESLMANGGRGAVIVGIDNSSGNRDSELTPDLGAVVPSYQAEFSKRTGEQFCDFVVNTVMPYVRKNYNVSAAPVDNAIVGSSSGGLEAFYIGMEHSDKFGQIGALSPAFLLFDTNVWNSYLSKFDFSAMELPRLYIYTGKVNLEKQIHPSSVSMYERLLKKGWQNDQITLVVEDNADHNEAWWRIFFPETLVWMGKI